MTQAVSSFRVLRPGRLSYADGLALQERLAAGRLAGTEPDTLIVLEHDPVVTMGRGGSQAHILGGAAALAAQGVSLHESNRGGDVTYHGPGQVVVYPIFDLKPDRADVRKYVCDLERVMIRLCADYGIAAGRKEGMIGCWLGGDTGEWRKIGAIGVHLSRWITTHGLAFNVDPDMAHFGLIVPCGISGHGVASLAAELDDVPEFEAVIGRMVEHFAMVFDATVRPG